MSDENTNVVKKAQDYYNSTDADTFYFEIWGGEDLHIGMYEQKGESIFDASRRTVDTMAGRIKHLAPDTRVLDIGAGYGGSMRHLVKSYGFNQVVCLNLSEVQNERDRKMNEEQGVADRIDVYDGNFEELPFDDDGFGLVWCQDSILHSGDRFKVFQEVDRVLKTGGEFIFTDPMQRPGVDKATLQPVLDRIHLDSLGSIQDYQDYAEKLGWESVELIERPEAIATHYGSVLQNLESREEELRSRGVSQDYIDKMKQGLNHWVNAGNKEALTWGILHFRKKS